MNGQVIQDAFPRWDSIMQRSREIHTSQNTASSANMKTRFSREADQSNENIIISLNGQSRSSSCSSHSSYVGTEGATSHATSTSRRQSRSVSRRSKAHAPSRSPSVSRPLDNNICHNPTGSQGNTSTSAPDRTIRRPWDTDNPSQSFNTQSTRNSML